MCSPTSPLIYLSTYIHIFYAYYVHMPHLYAIYTYICCYIICTFISQLHTYIPSVHINAVYKKTKQHMLNADLPTIYTCTLHTHMRVHMLLHICLTLPYIQYSFQFVASHSNSPRPGKIHIISLCLKKEAGGGAGYRNS